MDNCFGYHYLNKKGYTCPDDQFQYFPVFNSAPCTTSSDQYGQESRPCPKAIPFFSMPSTHFPHSTLSVAKGPRHRGVEGSGVSHHIRPRRSTAPSQLDEHDAKTRT